jgi:hypothetical protein
MASGWRASAFGFALRMRTVLVGSPGDWKA